MGSLKSTAAFYMLPDDQGFKSLLMTKCCFCVIGWTQHNPKMCVLLKDSKHVTVTVLAQNQAKLTAARIRVDRCTLLIRPSKQQLENEWIDALC